MVKLIRNTNLIRQKKKQSKEKNTITEEPKNKVKITVRPLAVKTFPVLKPSNASNKYIIEGGAEKIPLNFANDFCYHFCWFSFQNYS